MNEEPMMPDGTSPATEPAESEPGRRLGNAVPVGPGPASTSGGRSRPREGDLMSAPGEALGGPAPTDAGDAALLGLVDRLAAILERGDLAELEVSAGGTTIIVRSPAAVDHAVMPATFMPPVDGGPAPASVPMVPGGASPSAAAPTAVRPSVKAPLTGIFYGAPSPGATPYVAVGDHVSVGQIIGLIEAMKLFNEIKSDLAGRVVKICADNGQLVKAKSPLIEVEPA
jgi:acetyl-CoA carboxylase biotin carboxyl carrier protein